MSPDAPLIGTTPALAAPVTAKEVLSALVVAVIASGSGLLIAVMSCKAFNGKPGDTLLVNGTVPSAPVMALIILFGVNLLAWIPASILKTERFYDLTGGITYVALTAATLAVGSYAEQNSDPYCGGSKSWLEKIAAAMTLVWALRLSGFLFYRIHGSARGDKRFDEVKLNPARFIVAWMMQAMWCYLTTIAMVVQTGYSGPASMLVPRSATAGDATGDEIFFDFCTVFGIVLWCIGFALEVTADFQKLNFSKDSNNQGRFISTGVWAWSRHPNYFGEITLWVGIFVMGIRSYQGTQWIVAVSPLFVALLLLKISGLPLLESYADKKWGEEAAYQEYKRKTHVIVPFLRRETTKLKSQ